MRKAVKGRLASTPLLHQGCVSRALYSSTSVILVPDMALVMQGLSCWCGTRDHIEYV